MADKKLNIDITGNYYKIPVINEFPPVYDREVSQAELSMIYSAPSKCNFKAFKAGGEYIPPKKVAEVFNPGGGGPVSNVLSIEISDDPTEGSISRYKELEYDTDIFMKVAPGVSNVLSGPITIEDGTEYIYDEAFKEITLINDVTIPESVKIIGYGAFWNCESSDTDYTLNLPDSITNIAAYAFKNSRLGIKELPPNIVDIGESAFEDVTSLTGELITPSSLKYIRARAFEDCNNITSFVLNEGLEYLGEQSLYTTNTDISPDVIIPSTVTKMEHHVLNYCNDVTVKCPVISEESLTVMVSGGTVTLDGVKEIEKKGLYYADIPNLIIEEGLETIGDEAFAKLTLGNTKTGSDYDGELVLPSSLKSIGKDVFVNSKLDYITFKNNTETLDMSHFLTDFQGSSVEIITLPNNMSLGNSGGIHGAAQLVKIYIGESDSEDYGTESDITIPQGGCFSGNPNLTAIAFCNKPKSGELPAHALDGSNITDLYVCWGENEIANAPWGATDATIHYNTTPR